MPKTTEKYNCECGCHITEGNPLNICQHCDYSNKWFSQSEYIKGIDVTVDEVKRHHRWKIEKLRKDFKKELSYIHSEILNEDNASALDSIQTLIIKLSQSGDD